MNSRIELDTKEKVKNLVHHSYTMAPSYREAMAGLPENFKQVTRLRDLLEINYKYISVQDQMRKNLVARLKNGSTSFPGIIGYESDVLPSLIRAILAGHDVLLIGEIGQAKTRIAESVARYLLSPIPVVDSSLMHDIPTNIPEDHLVAMLSDEEILRTSLDFAISTECEKTIRNNKLDTRIKWVEGINRYRYFLATPDVSVKDLVGQVDAMRIAKKGIEIYDVESYTPGYLLQANHGMMCIDELPVLDPRKQVALLSVLQEGKFTTGSYPVTFRPDVSIFATANPTDYTHSGRIIEPLSDRLRSHIKTHYPLNLDEEIMIILQEARSTNSSKAFVPVFILKTLASVVQQARSRNEINQEKGVSVRMGVHSMELLISESERNRSLFHPVIGVPRYCDFGSILQAVKFELSEIDDSFESRSKLLGNLIDEALKKISLEYLDTINTNELQLIRKDFSSSGGRFSVSQKMLGVDPSSTIDYQGQLKKFPHLEQLVAKTTDRILNEQKAVVEKLRRYDVNSNFVSIPSEMDGELKASVIELVLEGLTWTEPAVLEKKSQSEFGLQKTNE
ncbi:MAG TPA: sigma 54-interacting transcriptional regulator [Nitrososphaeraceae archaeon]|nr:sigma 54-interacting transcriptional regulator [Nitrososphaeraceae archaeon]